MLDADILTNVPALGASASSASDPASGEQNQGARQAPSSRPLGGNALLLKQVVSRIQARGEFSESARRGSQVDYLEQLFRVAGQTAATLRRSASSVMPGGSFRELHDTLLNTVLLAQASGEVTTQRLADRIADELLLEFVQHVASSAEGLEQESLERIEYRLRTLSS